MALDQSFVGRTYPPTAPYEVGREKIREFAEAVGDTNPAYTDPEAAKALGHPDVVAPPTFVFAITFKAAGQVVQDPHEVLLPRGGQQTVVARRPHLDHRPEAQGQQQDGDEQVDPSQARPQQPSQPLPPVPCRRRRCLLGRRHVGGRHLRP